ncbi:2,3-bisphosphoglycerate-dependent phosphoglycerate mutase [uncultured Cytophaga sp.]|uniref:2,3-bisphosphoglycerate-dependent phosphoglycerate mutase n=1 Tax=uncultured Cytophaga sp. TaxID=160238 RepID=UPI0026021ECC|nr:2,3-bisphosphoglycerate-dependent phosphoglycerate mutase [uncultured Cytophaga sp.]
MSILVIVRHGQSEYNLKNLFTGWADVDLTPTGEHEAEFAGIVLKPYIFNVAYTSVLKRAIQTLHIILHEIDQIIPIVQDKALNERNYGDLQGLNKAEVGAQYGAQQLMSWRRSFTEVPPGGESLENTYQRVIPYYEKEIAPKLKAGQNILIVAHGNSLRALMMYLEHISPEDISHVDLATGAPRLYEFSSALTLKDVHYIKLPDTSTTTSSPTINSTCL